MSEQVMLVRRRTGVALGAAIAIMLMILVFFFIAGPTPEDKICYSYNEPRAGKFGIMVNHQVVAYAETKAEADKLIATYKECQGK